MIRLEIDPANPETIGLAIDALIDALDFANGDPDLEPNGDDRDGSLGEDDFCWQNSTDANYIAGCPLSDPDFGVEDDPEGIDPEDDYGADDIGEFDEYADEFSDPEIRIGQCMRIRRARCVPQYAKPRKLMHYRLFVAPETPTRRQLLRRKRGMPRSPRA